MNHSVSFSVGGDMILPGEHGQIRLTLFKEMLLPNGQAFTIRELGRTVATGIITKKQPSVQLPQNKLSKAVINVNV